MEGLSVKDVITVLISLTALGLSLFSLRRTMSVEKRTRALQFAAKKQETLDLILRTEVVERTAQHRLTSMKMRVLGAGLDDLAASIDDFILKAGEHLDSLQDLRSTLSTINPASATDSDMILLVDKVIPRVLSSGPEVRESKVAVFLAACEDHLTATKLIESDLPPKGA